MKEINNLTPIQTAGREAGYLVPVVGRKVQRDVTGFLGFPLIRAGETITREIAERATAMGRLYELTDATRIAS